MKNLFLFVITAILCYACAEQSKQNSPMEATSTDNKSTFPEIQEEDVFAGINLTVAESKRLIAKGIANYPQVKNKLEKGIIIITSGTTNTYIAEELTGLNAPHGSFMTGNFIPEGKESIAKNLTRVPNITLINGKQADIDYEEALKMLKDGDIVFKGGNLLNYEKQQAAVCIGAPDGGTTSRVRAYTGEGKGHLIVPIGLEKETFGDLNDYERLFESKNERIAYVPRVWVHQNAEIFTEIEAIKTFADVKVVPFGSGGIAGREGGVSLAIYGKEEDVQKVLDIVTIIQGEAPFVP